MYNTCLHLVLRTSGRKQIFVWLQFVRTTANTMQMHNMYLGAATALCVVSLWTTTIIDVSSNNMHNTWNVVSLWTPTIIDVSSSNMHNNWMRSTANVYALGYWCGQPQHHAVNRNSVCLILCMHVQATELASSFRSPIRLAFLLSRWRTKRSWR